MEQIKKLPDDREGRRIHFTVMVRDEKEDNTVEVREVDGYLHMNVMPDGKSLREIFVRMGRAGSSEALLDEWAKQVSNRLQEGQSVEKVFRPHVGTQFGDRGAVLGVSGVKSCTSVLDLIARIAIDRFGTEEERP